MSGSMAASSSSTPSYTDEAEDRSSGMGRTAEIAALLAAGLMRLRARKSSRIATDSGESSLHFSAAESGDPAGVGLEKWE
jgi:hypothetical protein